MDRAWSLLSELDEIQDYFFDEDSSVKDRTLRAKQRELLEYLDSIRPEGVAEKSKVSYIRGRALDVFDEYCEEAESCLLKAVKLDPMDSQSHDALGNCFWKKNELKFALACYRDAVALDGNIKSLRNLSMLLRKISEEEENPSGVLLESVEISRRALSISIADPLSWYNLGNAYVSLFFKASHDQNDLSKALQAYNAAEKNNCRGMPDLYFNRAKILQYKQDYQSAWRSFETAKAIDPRLSSSVPDIREHVEKLSNLSQVVTTKYSTYSRGNFLRTDSASRPAALNECTVLSMNDGPNPGSCIKLKVCFQVTGFAPPHEFISCDREGSVAILCIYEINGDCCSELTHADCIKICNPLQKSIVWIDKNENRSISLKSIQVLDPSNISVNGLQLRKSYSELKVDNLNN